MAQDTVKQIVVLELEIPMDKYNKGELADAYRWSWDKFINDPKKTPTKTPVKVLAYRLSEQEELTWIDET